MPERPKQYRPHPQRRAPDPRPTASVRGYGSRWQRARLLHLAEHPLCVSCESRGQVTEATVVDHRIPHRGDPGLFWDHDNWQSLCKECHDRKTATHDGAFGRLPKQSDD